MKTNLPHLQPVGKSSLPATFRKNYSFKTVYHRVWMFMLLGLLGIVTFAQNAIVGAGFAPGWGGGCGSNADFQYFSPSAGSSWIRTTKANSTGDQYFRLGVDWDGQRRQHTITIGSDEKVDADTAYTLDGTCTTSGAMFIDVANADHNYVFKTFNAGTNPQYRMVYFRVEGDIRTITNVSVPVTVNAGNPATVTTTLNGDLAAGQGVYLRYTTDAFATSSVIGMSGAGNSYSANIPGFAQGTEVTYYCFTSGSGLADQLNHGNADFFTINLNGNEGLNYKYTVQGPVGIGTIAPGNWSNPATWEGGVVPNSAFAIAIVRHNVTLDIPVTVKDFSVEASGIFSTGANNVTIANGGTISNAGSISTSNTFIFAGEATVLNAIPFFNVELNGAVNLGGSSVKNQLEIKSGGTVTPGGSPVYGAGAVLFINTGGAMGNGGEWTTSVSPSHVLIGASATYTLCNEAYTAAYTANGNLTIQGTGTFIADPLCNGDEAQDPGPVQSVDFLTIGQNLVIESNGKFMVQNGDVGSLINGTRFQVVIKGNLSNAGNLTLNNNIGDDLYLHGNWTNSGTFFPGSNSSSGDNPVTDQDGRAVFLNGTTPQSINGNMTNFHYLIIDNAAGITANTAVLVSRGLGLNAGKVNLNGNTFNLGTFYSNEGNGISYTLGRLYSSSATSYTYGGNFLRLISKQDQPNSDDEQVAPNLGEPYLFPVGTADDYRPFTVTYSAYPAAETALTVRHFGGAGIVTGPQPNLTDADGATITQHYTDAYWDVFTRTQINGTFDVSYTCNNCNIGVSNLDKIRAIRRVNAIGAWSAPGGIIATTGSNASPTIGRSGLTDFSQFGVGFDPVVLPVRLKTFTGTRTASGNRLSWVSSSEINFSHYELQRSTDSRSWEQIARINGSGGAFDKTYSHLDQKATGLNYYRLHMVDSDGSSRFSHIINLKGNEQVAGTIVAAYQPGMQHIILQHNGGGFDAGTHARISDINGRILTQQIIGSTNVHYLKTGRLAAGVYMVQVQQGKEQETIKVWVH